MNKKRRPRARKSGAKARKRKFLSLRRQFPAEEIKRVTRLRASAAVEEAQAEANNSKQLNLFPLHPENQVEARESNDHENENVAFFFSAADGGATSLTGLLDTSAAAESNSSNTNHNNSRLDDLSPSSASLTYAYGEERAALVRTALRNRERDSGEEKWVCYSKVVERKVKEEEVTSAAVNLRPAEDLAGIQGPWLKLDYEQIMNAWSNKGPLYIDSENSQIVPDINHDRFLLNNGVSWGCSAAGGLWTVPEIEKGEMRMKNGEEMKMGQREASVLRYKEKRQNRLFSKKIRYQVRKLNAEKRPRLKGRFVKRA